MAAAAITVHEEQQRNNATTHKHSHACMHGGVRSMRTRVEHATISSNTSALPLPSYMHAMDSARAAEHTSYRDCRSLTVLLALHVRASALVLKLCLSGASSYCHFVSLQNDHLL